MEEIKNKLEWAFSDLIFTEDSHSYFVNGVRYPSVSSLIHSHETKVDFKEIAKTIAKKRGVSVDEIQQEWDKIKNDACDLGTATHNYAENYTGVEEPINLLETAVKKFYDEMPDYYQIVYKELRMYTRSFGYAGTADLILLDSRTNTLVIADFKTNKDLTKAYHKLLPPFSDLDQSNFNKYQFQLSYYQVMLEEIGFNVSNRVLIWLKRDGQYEIHCTKDYTKELKEHRLSNKNNRLN